MMRDRLKAINAQARPQSTLQGGPSTSSQSRQLGGLHQKPTSEQTPKRQKLQHQAGEAVLSKFFQPKLKPHNDPITDGPEGKASLEPIIKRREDSRREVHDLTQDGSQADIDGASTVSVEPQGTSTGVPEFRNAQPKSVGGKSRPRTSRILPADKGFKDGNEARLPRHHLSPDVILFPSHSPDILNRDSLSPDEVHDGSIQSNIHGRAKRRRVTARTTGSEDELAADPPTPKKNNFSDFMPPRQSKNRGDIQPTRFGSAKSIVASQKVPSDEPQLPDICVIKAACGKFTYCQTSQPNRKVKLHLGTSATVVMNDTLRATNTLLWLEIQPRKIITVLHKATLSLILIIKRSSTNQAPGTLALKLEQLSDTASLVHWLCKANVKFQVEDAASLERRFKKIFEDADSYRMCGPTYTKATLQLFSPGVDKQTEPQIHKTRRDPFNPPSDPPTEKLVDKMKGSITELSEIHQRGNDTVTVKPRSQGPETRRTRGSSPSLRLLSDMTPNRWTEKNPDWVKSWHRSLVFPATGKDRATVDGDDISRLDEGEFLNDNLISFYFRYLQTKLQEKRPEVLQKVHFFNTFFFAKLKPNRGKINYEGVKSWTTKVDLFSYDYIVVPVNENMHWYLTIIYNAPKLLADDTGEEVFSTNPKTIDVDKITTRTMPGTFPVEQKFEIAPADDEETKPTVKSPSSNETIDRLSPISGIKSPGTAAAKCEKRRPTGGPQRFSPEESRIITLDSLGNSHPMTCKHLKEYLIEEARHKKNVEITKTPGGMTGKRIPQQDNHCDCGVFVLGYMEEFLKDPDGAVRKLLQKEDLGWNIKPSGIRAKVRDLLFELQHEQQNRLDAEKATKRQRKLAKEATSSRLSASQSRQSSPREPPESSKTPQSKRDIASPLANGFKSPAVTALQRVMSTTVSPRSNSSPDRPPQPHTPKFDEDPRLIFPLGDDSSLDTLTSTSNGIVHSARSSPHGVSQVPVDLTTGEPDNATIGIFHKRAKSTFVEQLPSSPLNSPSDVGFRGLKRHRSASPQITMVVEHRSQKSSSKKPRGLTQSPEVLPSIESDKTISPGPKYDGIDRTIDISS